ncbi:hypothetical protein F5883DRAFT_649735 [Diaporthe sp. PMI_573]|nr:hypothetical protein F5883DRAFT_649735 [Diaporthaceae sp. PMI_573]
MEDGLCSSSRLPPPPPPPPPPHPLDEADAHDNQRHQHHQHQQQQQQQNSLQFLPVNETASPPQSKYRRAYQSCEPCRRRKSRCVPNEPGQRRPCKRCVANGFSCDFQSTRSNRRDAATGSTCSGSPRSTSAAALMAPTSGLDQQRSASPIRLGQDTSPAQFLGTMPSPLAAAAVASSSVSAGAGASSSPSRPTPTARSRIISAQLHDTADALDLLTFTAAGERDRNSQCEGAKSDNSTHLDRLHHHRPNHSRSSGNSLEPGDASVPLLERPRSEPGWRESASANWDRFVLIKRRVVTRSEIVEYLDFYFDTLGILRPVVPAFYRDSDHYNLLPVREPLLLTGLVTLSSRYHPLSGPHGEIRSERIHWQAWKCLQKYLQKINQKKHMLPDGTAAYYNVMLIRSTFSDQIFHGGRMLLSSAIALAQEACCFDYESQGASAAGSEHETLRRQWN